MNLEIIVGKNYLGNYQMKYLTEFDLYNIVLVFFLCFGERYFLSVFEWEDEKREDAQGLFTNK